MSPDLIRRPREPCPSYSFQLRASHCQLSQHEQHRRLQLLETLNRATLAVAHLPGYEQRVIPAENAAAHFDLWLLILLIRAVLQQGVSALLERLQASAENCATHSSLHVPKPQLRVVLFLQHAIHYAEKQAPLRHYLHLPQSPHHSKANFHLAT